MSIHISGVVLAKGAPNRTQDGRTTMCSIVLSDELGLIRLYPLSVIGNQEVKVWTRIRCEVIRSQKDNRAEAFREYEDCDLKLLCRRCHEKEHGR